MVVFNGDMLQSRRSEVDKRAYRAARRFQPLNTAVSLAWPFVFCSALAFLGLCWQQGPVSLKLLAGALVVVSALLVLLDGGPQEPPRLMGGTKMQDIIDTMPLLSSPLSRLQYPPFMQLIFVAATNIFGKNRNKFRSEELTVKLEGESVLANTQDSVWIHWLEPRQYLAADAPIVILVPGLANTKDSLPGYAIYDHLLLKPWRVVVYEKRGVGAGHAKLKVPVLHIFGHPSDFRVAVNTIQERYPKAPLHFVSFSAGNGLCGSYLREFSGDLGPKARGALMLMGGEDYNKACKLRNSGSVDRIVEARLVQFVRNYFLRDNESLLKQHDPQAFAAAMAAENLHELYLATMRGFSGYSKPEEAERRINGFRDGNGWFKQHEGLPSLGIYTADDPVGWILASEWVANLEESPKMAGAVFAHGSHCACYNVEGGRWIDALILQWVEALEALAA